MPLNEARDAVFLKANITDYAIVISFLTRALILRFMYAIAVDACAIVIISFMINDDDDEKNIFNLLLIGYSKGPASTKSASRL